jgi:hypothetical protein
VYRLVLAILPLASSFRTLLADVPAWAPSVEDGLAVLRPVRIGTISVSEIEILSGLQEGEEIVLTDLTRFQGAQRILLR